MDMDAQYQNWLAHVSAGTAAAGSDAPALPQTVAMSGSPRREEVDDSGPMVVIPAAATPGTGSSGMACQLLAAGEAALTAANSVAQGQLRMAGEAAADLYGAGR